MAVRVPVKPELLRWACKRSKREKTYLEKKFRKLSAWESGTAQPTLKQLEDFAKATYTPFGYLFLDSPPDEKLPIADLRTINSREISQPSADLLDTIYTCQQRQEWYKDFSRMSGYDELDFVGSATMGDSITDVAEQMRRTLNFDIEERRQCQTWSKALQRFFDQCDEAGIMAMTSGVVGSNNKRKLSVEEFRGFALCDPLAPIVFVNGNDTKAAQMFTLAHELAHIWLGRSALSDVGPDFRPSDSAMSHTSDIEIWCNKVAAEFLIPLERIREDIRGESSPPSEAVTNLSQNYKVSTLVVLRRLKDAGYLSGEDFSRRYRAENEHLRELGLKNKGGGNFYHTTAKRVNRRFARELIASAFEGQTSFTEALRLLGIRKMQTFKELGNELGVRI